MVRLCLSEQLLDRKQHNIPFSLVIKNIPKFIRSKMSYYKDMNFYIDQSTGACVESKICSLCT